MAENVGSIYTDVILKLDDYKKGLKDFVTTSEKASNKAEKTFDRDYTKKLAESIDGLKNKTIGGLENKLSKLQDRLKKTEIGSVHFKKVSKAIEETQRKLDKANNSQSRFNKGISSLGGIAVGGAFAMLAKKASDVAAEYETLHTSFTVILKDANKATQALRELGKFADATPFQDTEVNEAAKMLLSFGFSLEKVLDSTNELGETSPGLLRKIGDIASLTKQPLNEMAAIFGKIKTSNKIMGDDLLQLGGRGIPIIKGLSEVLNVAESDVAKMVSTGKVGFKEVEQVLTNMTKKGGIAFGMMDKQSKTFSGMMSTLKGKTENVTREFGKLINKALKPLLKIAIRIVTNLSEWAQGWDEVDTGRKRPAR